VKNLERFTCGKALGLDGKQVGQALANAQIRLFDAALWDNRVAAVDAFAAKPVSFRKGIFRRWKIPFYLGCLRRQ
jgi:hypothetical protein